MRSTDRAKFAAVLHGMAAIKRVTVTHEAAELWWMCMSDWTCDEFAAAAAQLLKTCEFMPTPKDFHDLRRASQPTAGEAFAKAVNAAGSAIVCGQVTAGGSCGDPLIDAAVRAIGGYGAIAMCHTDKLTFLERRFVEHYESLRDVHQAREALPQLQREATTRRIARTQ